MQSTCKYYISLLFCSLVDGFAHPFSVPVPREARSGSANTARFLVKILSKPGMENQKMQALQASLRRRVDHVKAGGFRRHTAIFTSIASSCNSLANFKRCLRSVPNELVYSTTSSNALNLAHTTVEKVT